MRSPAAPRAGGREKRVPPRKALGRAANCLTSSAKIGDFPLQLSASRRNIVPGSLRKPLAEAVNCLQGHHGVLLVCFVVPGAVFSPLVVFRCARERQT